MILKMSPFTARLYPEQGRAVLQTNRFTNKSDKDLSHFTHFHSENEHLCEW
jgi:hypothetical protein